MCLQMDWIGDIELKHSCEAIIHLQMKPIVVLFEMILLIQIKSNTAQISLLVQIINFLNLKLEQKNRTMFRAKLLSKQFSSNSQFYHPCKFELSAESQALKVCALHRFIDTYRKYAHFYANLDPLNLYNKEFKQFIRPTDIGMKFVDQISSFQKHNSPLAEISKNIEQLQNLLIRAYRNNTAVEFNHVISLQQQQWLYYHYEKMMSEQISVQLKAKMTKTIVQAQAFDHFLHKKYVTFKRYSGQGAQSTVLALDLLFQMAAKQGYQDIVFGMPHRGRLNTLVNILDYPARLMFRRISGKLDTPEELYTVVDDVVSHVAQSVRKDFNGNKTKVTMVHNPSHLEAQNPVSMGKARSKQINNKKQKVLNIQVHGDSAISAQGVVYETFCLSKVPKFQIEGTIHLVTNNQIGYTTRPIDSRSSKYCSDIAKAFDTPIIHVNSENIEDIHRVMKLCVAYRKQFKKDIMVDLICYRKYGHNEVDQPEFTQPKMYHKIRKVHVPSPQKYSKELDQMNFSKDFYKQTRQALFEKLQKQFEAAKNIESISLKDYLNPNRQGPKAFTEQWSKFRPSLLGQEHPTGFDIQMLKQFANASVFYPSDFSIHARIKKYHIDQRIKSLQRQNLNWATCQALALFSLNYEGYNIRFTGQDVERGTFSQRHLNLVDQKTEQSFNPLQFFSQQQPGRGKVEVYNSPLTQNAAMSFQYGYSIDNPNNFVIWEAQFGDFFNTAQVVIDTFITNSESKWMRQNALVLNLPHGFDGAGPQHSSCRIQRFLQLANSNGGIIYNQHKKFQHGQKGVSMKQQSFSESIQEANFSFISPTKPANLFHALRRQMKRNFRKPLIIAGPKNLLRNSACVSSFEDMGPNSKFESVIPYTNVKNISSCQSVIICSGKFVYDILKIIEEKKTTKTALITVEQLFPFPQSQIKHILSSCSKGAQVYWAQQQNLNGGAFSFAYPRLLRILKDLKIEKQIQYVGRKALSTTAVGNGQLHKKQVEQLNQWISSIVI